ncbi:MAG: ParB/RepB/Spo0J family partition protein [Rickettsiales bacterium]|nr:ParB/RepB/Spo0J family partition protein [Rickettsiales bacterium]
MSNAPKKGLGKGLSALMSDEYSSTMDESSQPNVFATRSLPLDQIISGKYQPRSRFNEQYLQELADSIRKNGIMQPILVRLISDSDQYEIIAGERRWRAAQIAGLTEIPVLIKEIDDQQALELALVENIQRQDLTPLEEASGYQRLIDEFSYTQEELATTVGKSRSHVANLLRLLSLPEKIKTHLDEERLSMGHARALLNHKDAEALADEVVKRGLNVRQTENLCRSGLPQASSSTSEKRRATTRGSSSRDKDPDILALEETLSENLGLRVSINDEGQQGQIIISYDSLSQLDDILRRLGGGA